MEKPIIRPYTPTSDEGDYPSMIGLDVAASAKTRLIQMHVDTLTS